jgi:hypothetical protein
VPTALAGLVLVSWLDRPASTIPLDFELDVDNQPQSNEEPRDSASAIDASYSPRLLLRE